MKLNFLLKGHEGDILMNKKACAEKAATLIQPNTMIGLGGGSTVACLAEILSQQALNLQIVTPSHKTKLLCQRLGLQVIETCLVDEISVAFDGCDALDHELNGLKSGGGIHTDEKIIASMATDYVLLTDEEKLVSNLMKTSLPITLEVLESSQQVVQKQLLAQGCSVEFRSSSALADVTRTKRGNLLLDIYHWPKELSLKQLNQWLLMMPGVVDTSLFYQQASKAVITSQQGVVILERKERDDKL